MSRVLYRSEDATASVIYLRWASPPTSIVLPSSACRQRQSDGPPSDAGLRGLSSSDVYSTTVASRLVSSYLTFSPLPPEWKTRHAGLHPTACGGGCFLLHVSALADSFPLGSGMPCAAQTFLCRTSISELRNTDRSYSRSINTRLTRRRSS